MKISDFNNRPPGRPRSQKVHQAILEATRKLIMESGIHQVSMEAVASRAGVGKTTIYRRWSSKEELIAEAFGSLTDEVVIPDTGSILDDIKELINNILTVYTDNIHVFSMANVLAGAIGNKDLMDIYWEKFVMPRRDAFIHVLERGKSLGKLRHDLDVEIIVDILGGLLVYQLLFSPDKLLSPDFWTRVEKQIESLLLPDPKE